MVMQESYLDWFYHEDKTLGATLDPSELLVHEVVVSYGPSHG